MTKNDIQDKCLELLKAHNRASVALSMGTGKTLLGLKHMQLNYGNKFLVVAPKVSVFESWKEEAKFHNLEYLLKDISYCTYRSLSKIDLSQYDILYLDEVHNLLYSHNKNLSFYNGNIVGLTGTPPKILKSEKGWMVDTFCPIIYNYKTDEAINDKLLNNYQIIVHLLDLNEQKTIKVNDKFYTSELASYNYWSNRIEDARNPKELQICRIMRMKVLKDFESKEKYVINLLKTITNKCLIFANTQIQAEKLCKYTYHSKNPESKVNLELFKKGDINTLAAVEQLNEGINIPNLREGFILHSYGNERKASQKIGRFLRLNVEDTSIIHILCYRNTIDEYWVKSALENFEQGKITWNSKNLK